MKPLLSEMLEQADALYAERAEAARVGESIRLLREQAESARRGRPRDEEPGPEEDEESYEIGWRLGRALFFLGQESKDAARARRLHGQAVEDCERAVRLVPERVEALFWLGVNLALLARQAENPLQALRNALRARRALKSAAGIDPSYHAAGPLRVLARLEQRLPRLFGGSRKRALSLYRRAVSLAPSNTVTRLYLAELLLEIDDLEGARAELETIIGMEPDPAWAFEAARDRRLAQKMLDQLAAAERPIR
jgi:tetratricopeptide (TPR) repeat protein